jgi:hypothetical protein
MHATDTTDRYLLDSHTFIYQRTTVLQDHPRNPAYPLQTPARGNMKLKYRHVLGGARRMDSRIPLGITRELRHPVPHTARYRVIGFALAVSLGVKEDEDRHRWNGSIGTGMEFPLAGFVFDGTSTSLEYHQASGTSVTRRWQGEDPFRCNSGDEFGDAEFLIAISALLAHCLLEFSPRGLILVAADEFFHPFFYIFFCPLHMSRCLYVFTLSCRVSDHLPSFPSSRALRRVEVPLLVSPKILVKRGVIRNRVLRKSLSIMMSPRGEAFKTLCASFYCPLSLHFATRIYSILLGWHCSVVL